MEGVSNELSGDRAAARRPSNEGSPTGVDRLTACHVSHQVRLISSLPGDDARGQAVSEV